MPVFIRTRFFCNGNVNSLSFDDAPENQNNVSQYIILLLLQSYFTNCTVMIRNIL